MSICQKCVEDSTPDVTPAAEGKCKVCKPYASLSKNARLSLHFHNKLEHMGMEQVKDLARQDFLPKCISLAEHIVWAAC